MTDSRCAEFSASGVVDRYVAGRLDDVHLEEFERHLIGCRTCQESVRLGAAIRVGVAAAGAHGPFRRRRVVLIGGLALAAGIAAVVSVQLLNTRGLRALGTLESLPPYGGVEVRASVALPDSLFGEAMRLYAEGRTADAERALLDARARGADSIPTSFFLGALYLQKRETSSAMGELRAVLRRGESPYTAEAHYYMAKAWLMRGRADSALVHLTSIANGTPFAAAARALADSVAEVQR